MSLSSSLLMYSDVQAVMDRALEADIGIAVTFDKTGDAVHFRQRCYKFRALVRELAQERDINDPQRNSPYDALTVFMHKTVCEIRRRDAVEYNIRDLKA